MHAKELDQLQFRTTGEIPRNMALRLPFQLLCAAIAIWLLVLAYSGSVISMPGTTYRAGYGTSAPVTNSTLGFEKIYAISLPQRTDRQDALTLISVLSGLEIDISPGVRGEDVLEKTVPKIPNSEIGGSGFVGSWRAHMNVMKRIVDEKIATALVIEDDVDWDINVRQQMARIAHQFDQYQSGMTADWDVLWLGNVGERFPKDDERKIEFQDPTVPSLQEFSPGFNSVKSLPEQTRVIHPSDFPLCTYAYAVSYAGAQKILYHIGLDKVSSNFDNDLANNCWLYMNCISVTPPLFHFDRNIARMSKALWRLTVTRQSILELGRDSDTGHSFEHDQEPSSYKNIETSVRLRMKDKFGKQMREERVWRDPSEYAQFFKEALELPEE